MADIFSQSETLSLLNGKFILLMGDSNMRVIYKDIVYLLNSDSIIPVKGLQTKHGDKGKWSSFFGDKVLALPDKVTGGRDYFEEREYKEKNIHLRYHFLTKISGAEMESTLEAIEKKKIPSPNILIFNSCIWDLTRWGPNKEDDYKKSLIVIFGRIRRLLSNNALIIWTSTLPIATKHTKGGIFIKQLEFVRHTSRFFILEANHFTRQICVAFGVDFLDLHYHMRYLLHRRSIDGIHWEPQALRHITCLVLTHISLAVGAPLPGHVNNNYVKSVMEIASKNSRIKEEPEVDELVAKKIEKELAVSAGEVEQEDPEEPFPLYLIPAPLESNGKAENRRAPLKAKRRNSQKGTTAPAPAQEGNEDLRQRLVLSRQASNAISPWQDARRPLLNAVPNVFQNYNNFQRIWSDTLRRQNNNNNELPLNNTNNMFNFSRDSISSQPNIFTGFSRNVTNRQILQQQQQPFTGFNWSYCFNS